ncbi:MAG TPA: exopolysaccharide biosynthesis polyprenyl glycosylphosphotransferase [Acidimicrobiales bacterium]|nr:exopolysaccharide biosynthesis polyprenyl glycosylphosphotransferase [Acidimicrobiales bacterium]
MNARLMSSRATAVARARTLRAPSAPPVASSIPDAATRSRAQTFATRTGPWSSAWALLALTDAVSALAVFGLVSLSIHATAAGLGARIGYLSLTWGALVGTLWVKRSYRRLRRHIAPTPADELGPLVTGIVTAAWVALGVVALAHSLVGFDTSVLRVVVGFGACLVVLPLARAGALSVHSRVSASPARVLVLGTGTIASDVAARLTRSRHVELLGFVDDDPQEGQPVLGDLAALGSICALEAVDRVVVAFSRSHPQATMDTLRSLAGTVAIDIVPRYFELTGWDADLADLEGLAVISLDGGPPGPAARTAKRAIDIVGALVALIVFAPLLIAAAIGIKIFSPGPVLFSQERYGRHRVPFRVLKLRTMRQPNTEEAAADAARRVPRPLVDHPLHERRVTRIGRLLRRTGLDELPQLWNVLRGDMSLVGPRPFVPQECGILPGWVHRRFAIRPGLTGLWQVCGQHDLRFEELWRLDCQYVNTWSFKGDMRILAKTPGRLLRGGGGEGR